MSLHDGELAQARLWNGGESPDLLFVASSTCRVTVSGEFNATAEFIDELTPIPVEWKVDPPNSGIGQYRQLAMFGVDAAMKRIEQIGRTSSREPVISKVFDRNSTGILVINHDLFSFKSAEIIYEDRSVESERSCSEYHQLCAHYRRRGLQDLPSTSAVGR